jgi:hypothetical protein
MRGMDAECTPEAPVVAPTWGKEYARAMRACAVAVLLLSMESMVSANGGPFLVRAPGGDPATKGAPAPILPDLLPGREARLRVVKEELGFRFTGDPSSAPVEVNAQYSIQNPTDDDIRLEIGFPIVRGIFQPYYGGGMGGGGWLGQPVVGVQRANKPHPFTVITNSDLLTRIRRHAYQIIDGEVALRPGLKTLQDQMKAAAGNNQAAEEVQKRLVVELVKGERWSERDARLLANFARVIWQPPPPPDPSAKAKSSEEEEIPEWMKRKHPEEAGGRPRRPKAPEEVPFFEEAHGGTIGLDYFAGTGPKWPPYLGPLASLGELKATQLLSHLASCFKPGVGRSYETIFTSWGGDVRERSVDLGTGALRPRENAASGEALYARVEVFQPQVVVDPEKRNACENIAASLPVTFTFAPMNLIRTEVAFPKRSTTLLGFTYAQRAFDDTAKPSSYQLAYLVHPASFWAEFGPIHVTIEVPKRIPVRASVRTKHAETRAGFDVYRGVLKAKTGELLVAVPKAGWEPEWFPFK